MIPITSVSQFHAIREKSPTYIVYHSTSKCSACQELFRYIIEKAIPVYTINVEEACMSSLLHTITTLPTIEKYDYFTLIDSVEGYSETKLNTFFKKK